MHIPLYVSCDTLNKAKKPWSNVRWIGEETSTVCSIRNGLVHQVQLKTGNSQGVSKLNKISNNVSAVDSTSSHQGGIVYGILCSGELFFWYQRSNKLKFAKGIPELATNLALAHTDGHDGPFQSIFDKLKQFRHEDPEANEGQESDGETEHCTVPGHQQPKIFASKDCSKVIVVVGANQVYVWGRDLSRLDNEPLEVIPGLWNVVASSSDVVLPNQLSAETEISSCFCQEAPFGEQCFITFSFIDEGSLLSTTLFLQWRTISNEKLKNAVTSAFWYTVHTIFSSLWISQPQIPQVQGSLVSRYANGQSIICNAINSSNGMGSKLVYLHPLRDTVAAESLENFREGISLKPERSGGTSMVTDMAWSRTNAYIVGCLNTGMVFMATRMGPLLKISCSGENLTLQPSTLLAIHPNTRYKDVEGNADKQIINEQEFSVTFHPYCDKFLLSSNHRVSVLSLPENCYRDAEVIDQLIIAATHALHSLRNSSVTHDYAYIRSSTWRLAQSLPNLYQSFESLAKLKNYGINLWGKDDNAENQNNIKMPPSEGEQLVSDVIKHLIAGWTFLLTCKEPYTQDWHRRIKKIARLLTKFINVLMETTIQDDRLVHRAQIAQMLQVFHRFVSLLCVWPKSFHMLKSTLSAAHRIIHVILKCERYSREKNIIETLLILTQTVVSFEKQLLNACHFQSVMERRGAGECRSTHCDTPSCIVTSVNVLAITSEKDSYTAVMDYRLEKMWSCLHNSVKKVYCKIQGKNFDKDTYQKCITVLNLVQSKLQNLGCDFTFRRVRLSRGNKFSLSGMYYNAIESWRSDVKHYITKGNNRKKISKCLLSILYVYLILKDFSGISQFIKWLYDVIKFNALHNSDFSSHYSYLSVPDLGKTFSVSDKPSALEVDVSVEDEEVNSTKKLEQPLPKMPKPKKYLSDPYAIEDIPQCRSIKNLISSVRLMMGSLGRVIARVFLEEDVFVPLPHRPHVISPLWANCIAKEKDSSMLILSSEPLKKAVLEGHWTPEMASQALCFSGYWYDMIVFAQSIGDSRITLLASVIATRLKAERAPALHAYTPELIIKELILKIWHSKKPDASLFHCYQELLKLAGMIQVEVLPDILKICLTKIVDIVQGLSFIVPGDIYLPAPPVFCPQIGTDDKLKDEKENTGEKRSRNELASWVCFFTTVIGAAGVAQYLLNDCCGDFEHSKFEAFDDYYRELRNLSESLTMKKGYDLKGSEWLQISQLWQELLCQMWLLQCRDKLCLLLRKFAIFSSSHLASQRRQLNSILDGILNWTHELYRQSSAMGLWNEHIISTAVVAASNAPPSLKMAQLFAEILPDSTNLPSLLKDRAQRLFESWKSTNIFTNNSSELGELLREKRQKGSEDTQSSMSLYILYQNACRDAASNVDQSLAFHSYQRTSGEMEREYQKFVSLFASMTFAKDAESFPQYTLQVPSLTECAETVKELEFEGLRLKKQLFASSVNIEQNCQGLNHAGETKLARAQSEVNYSFAEKKGLFRNLTHSNLWQPNANVELYLEKSDIANNRIIKKNSIRSSRRTRSLSPAIRGKKRLSGSRERCMPKSSCSQSSDQSPASRTLRPSDLSSESSFRSSSSRRKRSRSFQISKRDEKIRHYQNSKTKTMKYALPHLGHSLKQFLYLIKDCSQKENDIYCENVDFIQWVMNNDKITCSFVKREMMKHNVVLKLNLNVEDLVCAFMWEDFPYVQLNRTLHEREDNIKDNGGECQHIPVSQIQEGKTCEMESKKAFRKHKEKRIGESWKHKNDRNHELRKHKDVKHRRLKTHTNNQNGKQTKCLPDNDVQQFADKVDILNRKENTDQKLLEDDLCLPLEAQSDRERSVKSDMTDGNVDQNKNDIEEDERNIYDKTKCLPENSGLVDNVDEGSVEEKNLNQDESSGEPREDEQPLRFDQHPLCAGKVNDVSVQNVMQEELKSLVQAQREGIMAMKSAVDTFQKTFTVNSKRSSVVETQDAGNQTNSVRSATSMEDDSKIRERKASIKKNSQDTLCKTRVKKKISDGERTSIKVQTVKESSSHTSSENMWKPFKVQSSSPMKPPRLVIEVQETAEHPTHHGPEAVHRALPKKSLTPVETPSEIFEPGFIGALKLLHMPDMLGESKALSLSDLTEDEKSVSEPPIALPVDDTLDDVTLPDSLHASDLEEGSLSSQLSLQVIQDKIIRRKSSAPKGEGSKLGRNVTLKESVDGRMHKRPIGLQQWDKRMKLKPVPMLVKPVTSEERNKAPVNIQHGRMMRMKLLVLPKQEPRYPQVKESPEEPKPLTLKRIPFETLQKPHHYLRGGSHIHKGRETQNRETFTPNENKYSPVGVGRPRRFSLLKLPPTGMPKVSDKGSNEAELKFLDPLQIFSFYKKQADKGRHSVFKTLRDKDIHHENIHVDHKKKETEGNVPLTKESGEQKRVNFEGTSAAGLVSYMERDEVRKPEEPNGDSMREDAAGEAQASQPHEPYMEDIPHDFVDKVQNYTKKYKVGTFKNVLENHSHIKREDTHSGIQYKITRQMSDMHKLERQHFQDTKETQTISKEAPETTDKESIVTKNKEYLEISHENLVMTPSEGMTPGNDGKPASTYDSRKVKTEVQSLLKDFRNPIAPNVVSQGVQSDSLELRDSWTETGSGIGRYPEKIEQQTQTLATRTVDASISAYLSPSSSSPPNVPQVTLSFNPSGLTLDPYTHVSMPGGGTAQVVDIPADIVKERLQAIGDELNQTIPKVACDEPAGDDDAIPDVNQGTYVNSAQKEDYSSYCMDNSSRIIPPGFAERSENRSMNLDSEKRKNWNEKEYREEQNIKSKAEESFGETYSLRNKIIESRQSSMNEIQQEEIEIEKGKMTMDTLMQSFIEGKLTFERFCDLSVHAVDVKGISEMDIKASNTNEGEVNVEEIEDLERKAAEAAKEIQDSRRILSRLDFVMQESQRLDAEKESLLRSEKSYTFKEKRERNSHMEYRWQKAQSLYKTSGDKDALLSFVEAINPEDITNEMIDGIIDCIEDEECTKEQALYADRKNGNAHKGEVTYRHGDASDGTGTFDSDLYLSSSSSFLKEILKHGGPMPKTNSSPRLHLDLKGLRSECSSNFCGSIQSSWSQDSSKAEREKQRKRADVRRWMNLKRKERLETYRKEQEKSGKKLNDKEKLNSELPGCTKRLSGKQIRDSSREREQKRILIREKLQEKLENDMTGLLMDHSEEVSSHRDLLISNPSVKRKIPIQSVNDMYQNKKNYTPPPRRKCSRSPPARPFNETYSLGKNISLKVKCGTSGKQNLNETYILGNIGSSKEKFSVDRSQFNQTFTISPNLAEGRSLASGTSRESIISGLSDLSSNTLSTNNDSLSNNKFVERELNNLADCLKSSREERKSNVSLSPNKSSKTEQHMSRNVVYQKPRNNSSPKEFLHQRTFSLNLALDRISEVDSDVSLSSSQMNGDEKVKTSRNNSSSDISWDVPKDVKKLLYK